MDSLNVFNPSHFTDFGKEGTSFGNIALIIVCGKNLT